MQHDIVEKLRPLLSVPVSTEERVVYILVEVRKLMDHAKLPETMFQTLRFFCNWVVHIKLTRGEGVAMVKAMNDIFAARLRGQRMSEDKRQELSSLFAFDTFRSELVEFLGDNYLSDTVLELLPEWVAFVKHYAAVVADCPLVYDKKDVALKWMDRVVISACAADPAMLEYYRAKNPRLEASFGMRWTFFKAQREVMKWETLMMYDPEEALA